MYVRIYREWYTSGTSCVYLGLANVIAKALHSWRFVHAPPCNNGLAQFPCGMAWYAVWMCLCFCSFLVCILWSFPVVGVWVPVWSRDPPSSEAAWGPVPPSHVWAVQWHTLDKDCTCSAQRPLQDHLWARCEADVRACSSCTLSNGCLSVIPVVKLPCCKLRCDCVCACVCVYACACVRVCL